MHTLIIGAGSAGCVLAARLSQDPHHRVTVLEAGPDYLSTLPADLTNGRRNSMRKHDWGFTHRPTTWSPPLPFPRGRVVGGSSAVNTCIAIRGTREDFDEWGELGLDDWSWTQCLPAFKRLEHDLDFADRPHHGARGPLPIKRYPRSDWTPWQEAFYEASLSLGHPAIDDHNAPDSQGVSPHPMNAPDGRRVSAAEAWLTPEVRARPNLRIQPHTLTHRVLFEGNRATGVEVMQRGARYTVNADRVALCAGAIQTPAILVRSGLGPPDVLHRLGVPPVAILPMVGTRLLDHPGFAMFLRPKLGLSHPSHPIIQVALRYRSSPQAPLGDMQVQPGSNVALPAFHVPFVSIMGHVGKPIGHGHLEFTSTDPTAAPVIHSNLMREPEDRRRAVGGLQLAYELSQTRAMNQLAQPLWPRRRTLESAAALDTTVSRWTDSGYHPCGTAPMGLDPATGATDGRGRVFGVDGLFVADASLMPTIPMGNIHLPTLMVAERIAGWMVSE